ncbi:MurR/RpiR family transcriptional regulator [Marinilactibacillus psychrotolerans]|uniref:RpiR family transcriptional regulator n=1 Tax=Marinilactibacillus psychrotolerans TaxID=191770 RepID=A0AAV3WRY8_9LACT|nr:MurR/RpiR family transcriptional regulator [Marinilactibacillus psychrotolerans]GEL67947.1 RpiR family transcriptional regulator [Marinilactibacillus psychrotolerans]GEQ35388.1 RpiR family transcriptional regulator [Marinilactibacillus psychrotolerans]SDD27152.1 transcriptional regulator, RpiR family [Marinilactibacillus psychrotolerans]
MTGKNILGRIKSISDQLPKAERKIARFILEKPEQVINMTASKLGQEAESSAATVIRLCKRVDIPSFTQLKVLISREVIQTNPIGYSDITPDEPLEDIMDKLLGNAFQSMQDTVSVMNEQDLLEAVESLKSSSIIYLYGIGASNLVAENIAHKWNRIGKTCICMSDPHVLLAAMSSPKENQVFFGISNSGETKEVVKILELAKENGYKTIALTQFGKNSLSKKADISLQHVRAQEGALRSAATSSLHAQFILVDILFYVYASKNYDKIINLIRHSREQIEKYSQ